ncbi:MAG: GNAT family N-acetyltransferase [Deltaproteobacteria bacterium]|nr:GNAT family N-acetyltransferase [Deltaproteobacteria bacterium]
MTYQIRRHSYLLPLSEHWDQLLDQMPASNINMRAEVLQAWYDSERGRGKPLLYTAWHERQLVAALPLICSPGTLLVKSAPNHSGQFTPLVHPAHPRALAAILTRLFSGPTVTADLTMMPGDDSAVRALESVTCEVGCAMRQIVTHNSGYVRTDVADFETYYQGLSAKMRKNLRRDERWLSAQGDLKLVRFTGTEPEFPRIYQQVLECEAKGWKGQAGTATLNKPRAQVLVNGLLRYAISTGNLELYVLWVGERLASFRLGVRHGRTWCSFTTSYDPDLARGAPGAVIAIKTLKIFIEDPTIDQVDTRGVLEDHKARFRPEVRPILRMLLYRPGIAGELTKRAHQDVVPRLRRGVRSAYQGLRQALGSAENAS